FFSSRRRHTRCLSDWSSDVCSSDLTGTRVIYGKTPLDDAVRRLVPPAMYDGFTAIVGGHIGLATGLVEFRQSPPDEGAAIAPGIRLSPAGDYLMWGVSAQHNRLPAADAELG